MGRPPVAALHPADEPARRAQGRRAQFDARRRRVAAPPAAPRRHGDGAPGRRGARGLRREPGVRRDPPHRFLPVAEDDGPATAAQKISDIRAADTFLADITDLAEQHDARVAVVLGPVAASLASTQVVPLGRERDFVDYANARHIGWIDLRSAAFSDQSFSADGSHMRADAAQRFSGLVGERLQALGALDAGPMAPASLVSVAKVERTGTPPDLHTPAARSTPTRCLYRVNLQDWSPLAGRALAPRIGAVTSPVVAWLGDTRVPTVNLPQLAKDPCGLGFIFDGAGTVVTLPEGTSPDTLRVTLDPDLPDPDTRQAATWWVYPGTGVRWTLEGLPDHAVTVELAVRQLADGAAPTLRVGGTAVPFIDAEEGLLARATLAPGAPPTVEISQDAAAPFLILRRLSILDAQQTTDLITRPLTRAIDPLAEVTERSAPPSLDLPSAPGAGGATVYTLPWTPLPGCAHFVVRAGDALVPGGLGKDRQWWISDRQLTVVHAGGAPSVSLDPAGACGAHACTSCMAWHWLYPGDRIVAQVSKARRAALPGALRSIHLRGEVMAGGAPDATLTVITRWKGTVMVEATHPVSALADGVSSVFTDFIPRIEPESLEVELQLSPTSAPVKLMAQAMPQ